MLQDVSPPSKKKMKCQTLLYSCLALFLTKRLLCVTLFKARHKHSVAYSNVVSLRITCQIIFTLKSNVVNVFNISMRA